MTSSTTKFNIEDWEFKFENLFDFELARDDFGKFMASSHNAEPFHFYVAVEELKVLRSASNQVRSAKRVIETFIKPYSKQEINIDEHTRSNILRMAQELGIIDHAADGENLKDVVVSLEQQKQLINVFGFAQNIVFREMKEDNFPRYLRSKQFVKFIKSKPSTLDLIASRRTNTGKGLYRELPSDINSYEARIRESDFDLVQDLAQDSTYGWKLISNPAKTGVAVYASNYDVTIGKKRSLNGKTLLNRCASGMNLGTSKSPIQGSIQSSILKPGKLHFFKFVGTIKHSYHVVCSTFSDPVMRLQVDPNLLKTVPIDFLSAKDDASDRIYSSAVIYQTMRVSKLTKPQSVACHISLKHIPETNRYVHVIKSARHEKAEGPSTNLSAPLTLFGGNILQKVDDHTTRYTTMILLHWGGQSSISNMPLIADSMSKYFGTQRARRMHRNLEKVCKKAENVIGDVDKLVSVTLDRENYVQKTMLESAGSFTKSEISTATSTTGTEQSSLTTDTDLESASDDEQDAAANDDDDDDDTDDDDTDDAE